MNGTHGQFLLFLLGEQFDVMVSDSAVGPMFDARGDGHNVTIVTTLPRLKQMRDKLSEYLANKEESAE